MVRPSKEQEMKLYWANAKTEDLEILTTYEGCLSIEEAEKVFPRWQECGYRIKEAWITEYEDGIKVRDIKVGEVWRCQEK